MLCEIAEPRVLQLGDGESGGGEGAPASVASAEGSYVVPQWETYVQANRSSSFRARIGLLGSQLDSKSLAAIGPGAALALADSAGTFRGAYADVPALPGSVEGTAAERWTQGPLLLDAYHEIAASRDLVIVDLDLCATQMCSLHGMHQAQASGGPIVSLRSSWRHSGPQGEAPGAVEPQLAALDARFGALLEAIETVGQASGEVPRIITMSVGDSQNSVPQLGFFAMRDVETIGRDRSGGSEAVGAVEQDGSEVEGTTDKGDDAGVVGEEGGTAAGAAQLATSDATRQWGLVQLYGRVPNDLGERSSGFVRVGDQRGVRDLGSRRSIRGWPG